MKKMDIHISSRTLTTNAFPVYVMRPMFLPLYRYANGKWIEDDGEWDLAFITRNGDTGAWYVEYVDMPYYLGLLWKVRYQGQWHYMLDSRYKHWVYWKDRYRHPNIVAGNSGIDYCIKKLKCGAVNGTGPEFQLGDKYIRLQLVRYQETGEVVTFPSTFTCSKCGLTLRALGKDGVVYVDTRENR